MGKAKNKKPKKDNSVKQPAFDSSIGDRKMKIGKLTEEQINFIIQLVNTYPFQLKGDEVVIIANQRQELLKSLKDFKEEKTKQKKE